MSKPVDKEEFWKKRLQDADKLYWSVYLTHDTDWQNIEREHKKILEPYKDKKVLDAGCGYGRASEWFTNYTGIDLSPDFIEKAKEMYPDKEFLVGRLEELPFEDKEFDMAVCVSIKKMIIDNQGEEAWKPMEDELRRVAKEVLLLEYTEPNEYQRLKDK